MKTRKNAKAWGQHLVIDAKDCNSAKIRDADHIKEFAKTLVKAIHMKAYGEPQVVPPNIKLSPSPQVGRGLI